jgi:hypothetical protein
MGHVELLAKALIWHVNKKIVIYCMRKIEENQRLIFGMLVVYPN